MLDIVIVIRQEPLWTRRSEIRQLLFDVALASEELPDSLKPDGVDYQLHLLHQSSFFDVHLGFWCGGDVCVQTINQTTFSSLGVKRVGL